MIEQSREQLKSLLEVDEQLGNKVPVQKDDDDWSWDWRERNHREFDPEWIPPLNIVNHVMVISREV